MSAVRGGAALAAPNTRGDTVLNPIPASGGHRNETPGAFASVSFIATAPPLDDLERVRRVGGGGRGEGYSGGV